MKAIYRGCVVGLDNGKELDGDVIDEVAQETIGAILSKLQAIAVLIRAITVSKMR